MTDRKKVVRAVETCFDSWIDKHRNMGLDLHEVERLKRDVLELLKEKEPKQVIGIADSIEGMEVGYCPSCDRIIVNKKIDETKFCKFCGQAVKWNAETSA